MESSNLKNMVVLKNLPSNIVDEAIIILKSNKKIKNFQSLEGKKNLKNEDTKKDKEYILKEAEMILNSYVTDVEKKDKKKIFNKEAKEKYSKLKKYSMFITAMCILEMVVIIF